MQVDAFFKICSPSYCSVIDPIDPIWFACIKENLKVIITLIKNIKAIEARNCLSSHSGKKTKILP